MVPNHVKLIPGEIKNRRVVAVTDEMKLKRVTREIIKRKKPTERLEECYGKVE